MRDDIVTMLSTFWEQIALRTNLPKTISGTEIAEIVIISILLYYVLLWIKNTRAWTLLKGILVILLFVFIAAVFQMNTIMWIAERAVSVAITAVIVIFQPEMRKALENLGNKKILGNLFYDPSKNTTRKFSDKTVSELVKACCEMGRVKTGALIVLADEISLTDYEQTGIAVDGILTSQLLINIFEKNTPLHDGAVIVRGDRVVSATCYLPLTDSMKLSKDLGTRHRAAVGISEVSDSFTIVVSEETGKISAAQGGSLMRDMKPEDLTKKLVLFQRGEQENSKAGLLRRRLKGDKDVRKEAAK